LGRVASIFSLFGVSMKGGELVLSRIYIGSS
jgi:hypothetical protein